MKNFKSILLAFISSIAIWSSYSILDDLRNFKFYTLYNSNMLLLGLLLVIFIYLFIKNKDIKISKTKVVVSVILSLFMIIGEVCNTYGDITVAFNFYLNLIYSIIKYIGYFNLFKLMFIYLDIVITKLDSNPLKPKKRIFKWYINKITKYPFRTSFVTLLILFGIYMIAFYPLVLSPDPRDQLYMFLGVPTEHNEWVIMRNPNVLITNHHPILQTYFMGGCLTIGRHFGNDNFGLFIYTIIQSLIYASILAYSIKFMNKHNVSNKYYFIVLLMYLLVPMYAFFTVSAVKDTLYTGFMMLFILFVFDIVENYLNKKISIKYLIYIFFVMLLMCLFRNNGIYICLLTLPVLFFMSKINRIKILTLIILLFGSMQITNKVVIPALGVSDGSIREALSIPFQQTARLVKYNSGIIDDEDKDIIDKVLVYDTLDERYDPNLSDPVKNKFNPHATKEDLMNYFKVWFKYLLKDPMCYINATLDNTFGYIYPNVHRWYLYYDYWDDLVNPDIIDYHFEGVPVLRMILRNYGETFPFIPLVGLLSNIGASCYMVIILTAYLFNKKNKKYIVVLLPMYLSILICIAGPANTYFRYVMPYMFVLPSVTCLLLSKIKEDNNEKK